MNTRWPVRGLYVITGTMNNREQLCASVAAAVAGGARLVQYRNKQATAAEQLADARALREICGGSACLIINDDPGLAVKAGADGVHVGQDCSDLRAVREQIGPQRLLGVTCHASIELAAKAQAAGADYVAFGAFHPSPTKPQASRAPISILKMARQSIHLPIVAIGGINADNAGEILRAGADSVAVISAVFGADDPQAAAQAISALFSED